MKARMGWKLQDVWVGVYWEKHLTGWTTVTWHVWICLLPCVPLHLWWDRPLRTMA